MEEVLSNSYGAPSEVSNTAAADEDKVTRQRFNPEHDETLLQEVLNVQPYSAKFGSTIEQWKTIAAIFNGKYNRNASWKTLQNRTRKLLKSYKPKNTPNRRQTSLELLLNKCVILRDKSCHTTNKGLKNAQKSIVKAHTQKKEQLPPSEGPKLKRRRNRDSVDSTNGMMENTFSFDEEESSSNSSSMANISVLDFQKQKLEFEREKWQKEMEFRERQLAIKERQMELQERRFALESDERMALINTLLHRTEHRLTEG